MFKKILGNIFRGVGEELEKAASSPTGGQRVFLVRDRAGHMDAYELSGHASEWDRVAISKWAAGSDALFGFSADPDGDGIEDWKGQGWPCGFYAADAGDAIERARTGQFSILPAWYPA